MAASRPEHRLHGGPIALQMGPGHKGLDGPCKAAPLHPPGSARPLQQLLAEGQSDGKPLVGRVVGTVDVLAQGKGGVAAGPHQGQKLLEAAPVQSVELGQGPPVLLKEMQGPQHSPVAAAAAQPGQLRPELLLGGLAQHRLAQGGGHGLHLPPDGRKLPGQLTVAAPGIGDTEAELRGQQPLGVQLSHLGGSGLGKVRKHHPAHCAGQLVQQTAGLAEVGVLCLLADQRHPGRGKAAAVLPIQGGGHPHLKGSRAGQPRPPQHAADRIQVEPAEGRSLRPESLRDPPDQAGGVGALPRLRPGLGQVDHIQLVESPALDPDVAVDARGRHRHQVQVHRCGQPEPVLVVGVVASQLRPARGRVEMHLPPRPEIPLELGQGIAVPPALPGQHRLLGAIQGPESLVPLSGPDLLSALSAGCHASALLSPRSKPGLLRLDLRHFPAAGEALAADLIELLYCTGTDFSI